MILERPTGPLNQNIANLWLYLVALGGGAMVAAVLIAIYLARWVSRPLARLDAAARKIADGDLTVRARTGYGPPELRRMAATFNMMAGRLEALVHGHRAMLADASHQLRTPLTALRLRLDLLADRRLAGHRGRAGRGAGGDRPAVPAGRRAARHRPGRGADRAA